MIISASRRTDIPAYYSDWFYNRIKEGSVCVRNPMNFRQISRIKLTADVVDGIVFWTKNPAPMMNRLDELNGYAYYFQFTLTPYGTDIEKNIPDKSDFIIPIFKKLSDKIGADRVIWRYDPILINVRCSIDYHKRAFEKIARELSGYTKKVTISFIDTDYKSVKGNARNLSLLPLTDESQTELSAYMASVARSYGMTVDTCSERIDLDKYGIEHARCIDDRLLSSISGNNLVIGKDKNQRHDCGCVSSIDIGMYNTCKNGCLYCYANYNPSVIDANCRAHSPLSPLISGKIQEGDKIHEREVQSNRAANISSLV